MLERLRVIHMVANVFMLAGMLMHTLTNSPHDELGTIVDYSSLCERGWSLDSKVFPKPTRRSQRVDE